MNNSGTKAPYVLLVLDALLLASPWVFSLPATSRNAILLAATGLLIWQGILLAAAGVRSLRIEPNLKKPHYVQTILQCILYAYWGLYWVEVRGHVPLLIAQLLFAYLFEMLLAWSRGRAWHWGFGQFPIVLSINLFIWFRPDYFYWQFVLVALAYLGKEFVTWTYAGRRRHIFNPSAFCLASVSALLMLTKTYDTTRAVDIVESFALPPSFYEVVFLLGLVVQILFGTTVVTLFSALALYLMFVALGVVLGEPPFDVAIGGSVFLGLTLLVTDPSTSPRTTIGKLLFGLTYGGGIFVLCILFRYIDQPTVFDKILMVPVVNLMVPWFDRAGGALQGRVAWKGSAGLARYDRFAWLVLYTGLFIFMLPGLKRLTLIFESPLPPAAGTISADLNKQLFNRKYCQLMHPRVYEPFGFSNELRQYPTVMALLRMEPEQVMDKFQQQVASDGGGTMPSNVQQLQGPAPR